MNTNFKEIKEEVLSFYEKMLDTVRECEVPQEGTTIKWLASQADKIKEDKFCLLIAGEAKSGKSTFINAYLGTEILPMDVRQCTSAVIEIAYGESFCLKATYADDNVVMVTGEKEINEFLMKNAALDDNYRDIPIPTINNEIILKYKNKKVSNQIIEDLINGVKLENIHKLPEEQYSKKIKDYIEEKQKSWKKVVAKLDIFYPFEDENMKGVRIIDSPGVNAAGKVGDATELYIESADAIMFLRPIVGQAIEANSFKEFLESKSVDRNKNAMFLILTRTAGENLDTITRAYEEFVKIFGEGKTNSAHGIVKEQIIPVDSKAELYFNKFKEMSTPEIASYIKQLRAEQKAESFLALAWADSLGDKVQFQEELKMISNFSLIDQALNTFGRKAQYIALSEFLGRIIKTYEKIIISLKDKIDSYELKAEDPKKLTIKIKEAQDELRDIENRLNEKADEIEGKYAGSKSMIQTEAEKVMDDFLNEIKKLNAENTESIDTLEKISFRKVDRFVEFQEELQKNVVTECNEVLKVALRGKNTIEFSTLEPDLTPEIVEEIRNGVKNESNESYTYTTGKTFTKSHTRSRFSQKKYYKLFSDSITERIVVIKNQAVRDLRSFVRHVVIAYTKELRRNAEIKRVELNKIECDKKTAEEIQILIERLKKELKNIEPIKKNAEQLKGGIDGRV